MAAIDARPVVELFVKRRVVTSLVVFVGCYFGARAGTAMVFPGVGAAVLFPPYAVLTAALILSPQREWWMYVLAAALGNFWPHLKFEGIAGFVVMAEMANASRALIAAAGVRWLAGSRGVFDTLRGVVVFIVFAVFVAPAVAALIGALAVVSRNHSAGFGTVWQAWFLSNVLTGLTLLPIILIVCTRGDGGIRNLGTRRAIEAIALFGGLFAVGAFLFAKPQEAGAIPASLYVPLPLLLWAAMRFGPRGVIGALAIITALTVGGALRGRGPFVSESPAENIIQLQYFLISLCIPLLLLAAIVSEQTRTATELKQNQANYRAVVEDQTELICRFLPDGTFTFVNDAYCRYFKRPCEELLGRTFWEFVPIEEQERTRKHLASITADRPVKEIEHEVIAPGGEIQWQHWTDRALFDERGKVVAYQSVGRDITRQKKADADLRAALNEVRTMKDRLQAENTYLQEELSASERFGDVVCKSPAMRQTLAQVQRVAATDATVLILGETGVGKEVIARMIHRTGSRNDKPFVRLNCAALPANLIESELFGHERGAFTGAAARRLGRFEVADGATLFLDEIGELSLDLQAKLLRVLQENEFERLGSSQTIQVDVRLVAATSRDLAACVKQGTFRADLYYRLNVFPITVPPLRARREDIVPLASTFMAAAAQRLGREFGPINVRTAELLMGHNWPGNVRELENVIERAAISSPKDVLVLPEAWSPPAVAAGNESASGEAEVARPHASVLLSIENVERIHIVNVLKHTHWRIEGPRGAAVILGIKPSTLRFRMKKLSISRDPSEQLNS